MNNHVIIDTTLKERRKERKKQTNTDNLQEPQRLRKNIYLASAENIYTHSQPQWLSEIDSQPQWL